MSLDTTLYGNALSFLNLSGKNFQRRTFLQEQIFTTWHSIAKIAKIFALQKFPAIQYHKIRGQPAFMMCVSRGRGHFASKKIFLLTNMQTEPII